MMELPESPRGPTQRPPPRGKLKILLGYAPGVGKTYKMLELARELAAQRADVVVGYVETHGRYDVSSMVLGLEILPRRTVGYRGGRLEKFDLEAALGRGSRVLILDELAPTNAPGGLYERRWHDVRITLPCLDPPPPVPAETETTEGGFRL
jgi:two-component system sensor histidine kinase KdpD